MKRILAAALAALLLFANAALPALTPGVVWPHPPAGIASSDYVATTVPGLLALIESEDLAVSDPSDITTHYYLPAPIPAADIERFLWVMAEWEALPDTSRAKIHFRIY